MITAIKVLKDAMAYAKFADKNIAEKVDDVLDNLNSELVSENYDEGDDVMGATSLLRDALDETDEEKEDHIKGADDEDDDEEFEGLGEDDEDE